MSITAAAGYPQRSGGLNGAFIPELWSGLLNEKYYATTVLSEIANTKWEGEIKDVGDKVHIRQTPDITIKDYVKGQVIEVEDPVSNEITFTVDYAKYFAFRCDDIDKVQADINFMEASTDDAGKKMKLAIDGVPLNNVYLDVVAANKGSTAGAISGDISMGVTGTPIQITASTILDKIIDLGLILDEQNVPEDGRWLLAPAWFCAMIKKSDLKNASITGDGKSTLRTGRLGEIDRFTLYSTNLLSGITDGAYKCFNVMGGHPDAVSYASQITKLETFRSERSFGDNIRGLSVFGWKTVKPEALSLLYCRK